MISNTHALWCEKYRPRDLTEYVFHDTTLKSAITKMVEDDTIPHLLFSGTQGTGKTALSQILIANLSITPEDVLIINASDENSVDIMRAKIKDFVSTWAMSKFKIVLLEEADYITPNGQAVLRRLMEEFHTNARFILTCNYDNKIIAPIKSRCQQFIFKAPNIDDVAELIATILMKEQITFDIELLDRFVAVGYPDIRKIINLIQQHSIEGTLVPIDNASGSADYRFALLDLLASDNWEACRTLVCENTNPDEWDELYEFLYNNLDKSPKFKNKQNWEQGIMLIADHLYKHSFFSAPEINAAALFINLQLI